MSQLCKRTLLLITITGVEQVGANAEAPGISLLYPNEYLLELGTSGFIQGSY